MARRPRFHLPYSTYHVMLRGNDGQKIFFSDADRAKFCLLIQEGKEKFGHQILAFCLMTNHVHLAIKVKDVSISSIIQHLSFRFTRYINRYQKKIGHLFQGRFKSILVDDEKYLKELIRYIHLNPVRAGIISRPELYPWSGHNAYLNKIEYTWLENDYLLKHFGQFRNEAITSYEEYILNGIGKKLAIDFKSGYSKGMLGDELFVKEILNQVSIVQLKNKIELSDLILKVCEICNITKAELYMLGKNQHYSYSRALLSFLVREIDYLTLEELSKIINRDASGLTKLANRFREKSFENEKIMSDINRLRNWIKETEMSECQA